MSGGEEDCEWPALGLAHDSGTLATDGVHDSADVVHPLL